MHTPPLQKLTQVRIALIGLGRLGGSLAAAFSGAGCEVVSFLDTGSPAVDRASRELGLVGLSSLAEFLGANPDVIFLTVPDASVPAVASELAQALRQLPEARPRPAVIHCSGVTPVETLAPCAQAGAVTLTFHPLQTFSDPGSGAARLRGAAIAVTPGPGGGFDLGRQLAESLGARPFLLPENRRALYHAAACVASNYLVALEDLAEQMFEESGLPKEEALQLFLPLVRGAVDNMAAQGTTAALTGPLSRGDVPTIAAHLAAIAQTMPQLDSLYRTLGLATLDIVRRRGEVPEDTIQTLERLVRNPATPSSSL